MNKKISNSGKQTDNKRIKRLKKIIVLMIFITGIILVFKDWFYSVFIQKLIIPVFSIFRNYNLEVGIGIFLLFLCLCYRLYNREKNRIVYPENRYCMEAIFFILYFVYKFLYHDEIIFYSMFHSCWFSYVDEVWICIFITESILAYNTHNNRITHKNAEENNKYYPFITDEPSSKDDFKREDYAEVLIEKILTTFAKRNDNGEDSGKTKAENSSFVINISESYGYGKTSFFLLLKNQIKHYDGKLILFEYRAWLCDSPQKITREFFKILSENLSPFIPDMNKKIRSYVSLLLEYSSSKSIFPYLLNNFLKEQSSILKERVSLKDDIRRIDKPIVILIDDVDRLHDDELMAFLSLLRNTADFPNIFYILAADIEYIKKVLLKNGVENPDSYLDKFINLEFLLPGYDDELMDKIFEKKLLEIFNQYEPKSSEDLLKSVKSILGNNKSMSGVFKNWSQVFKNIRSMKRFLNVYSLAIDFYIKNNKNSNFNLQDDIDLADLFAIELIKYLSESIYKILRDHDDWILELKHPQLEPEMRYCLKEDFDKIVKEFAVLNKKVKKDIEFLKLNVENKGKKENKSKEEKTNNNDEISSVYVKDLIEKNKNNDYNYNESICLLLKFLFFKDSYSNVNRLCYKDSYFKYFSYRFKGDQITVNEADYIFNSEIEEYKKGIKTIFEDGKQDSFIHKIRYMKNAGYTDMDFVRKLFYFIEEACVKISLDSYIMEKTKAQKEKNVCEKYNIFAILFSCYKKENYEEKEKIEELKNNMKIFIFNDKHINLLFLLLKNIECLNDERSLFSCEEIRDIGRCLINKRIIPICKLVGSNNFKWNNEYINVSIRQTPS